MGACPLKALEPRPRAGGGPPPCNVATVAMGARVNNSMIAVTQPYMFELSEPGNDSESESDKENAQPRASQFATEHS